MTTTTNHIEDLLGESIFSTLKAANVVSGPNGLSFEITRPHTKEISRVFVAVSGNFFDVEFFSAHANGETEAVAQGRGLCGDFLKMVIEKEIGVAGMFPIN